MFVYCKSWLILYNRATFDAILHQARKKPLVTANLPVLSYARGWRCEAYYDQFPVIGQVILRKLHCQPGSFNGERRCFLSKPIATYNPIARLLATLCCWCGCAYWRPFIAIACCLIFGYVRVLGPVITNKKSQVLVVPGSCYFMVFNCIFR
jgi:hypothetical protein